jgi:hypothetical protein
MRLSIFVAALVLAKALRPDFDVGAWHLFGILFFFLGDTLDMQSRLAVRDKRLGLTKEEVE